MNLTKLAKFLFDYFRSKHILWPFWKFSVVWFCSSWTAGRGSRSVSVGLGSEHRGPDRKKVRDYLFLLRVKNVFMHLILFVILFVIEGLCRPTYIVCNNHNSVCKVKILSQVVWKLTSGFFFPLDLVSFPRGGNERTFFLALFPIGDHSGLNPTSDYWPIIQVWV